MLLALVLAALFSTQTAVAQAQLPSARQPDVGVLPVTDPLTPESLQAHLDRLAPLAPDDETKKLIVEWINVAISDATKAQLARTRIAAFTQQIAQIPGLITQLTGELEAVPSPDQTAPDTAAPDTSALTLEQIVEQRKLAENERDAARDTVETFERQFAELPATLDTLNETVPALRNDAADAQAAMSAALDAALSGPAQEATRLVQRARAELHAAQIAAIEHEIEMLSAQRELLPLQITKSQRRLDRAGAVVQIWETTEAARRDADAARAAADAAKQSEQAENLPAEIQAVLAANEELAKMRAGSDGVAAQLKAATARLNEVEQQITHIGQRRTLAEKRMRVADMSTTIGLFLRKELASLPSISDLRAERAKLRTQLAKAHYTVLDLEENRITSENEGAAADALIEAVLSSTPGSTPNEVGPVAIKAIASQRKTTDILLDDYETLAETLPELSEKLNEVASQTQSFRTLIEERVLWIRSVPGSIVPKPIDIAHAAGWLVNPSAWSSGVRELWNARAPKRIVDMLGAASVLVLFSLIPLLRKRLVALAPLVARFASDKYRYSVDALLLTIAIALFATLPFVAFGYWLSTAREPVLGAAGHGLMFASMFLFVVVFVRAVSMSKGLASSHFRWNSDGLAMVSRTVTIASIVGIPLVFIWAVMAAHTDASSHNSLGRIMFVLMCAVLTIAHIRIFNPKGMFVGPYITRRPDTFAAKLRRIWYPCLVGMPIVLGVLAILGWYYTAIRIDLRVHLTIWMVVALILLNGMMLRWLFIERRRLALDRARKKREAEQADEKTPLAILEESQIDIPEIDTQTRRVIRACVALIAFLSILAIWADVLPALRMLDRVQLWPNITYVSGNIHDIQQTHTQLPATTTGISNDQPTVSPSTKIQPATAGTPAKTNMTLMDVLAAIVVMIISIVLARNVPGLLEILVLKKLPIDSGSRFAITTIVRYLIVLVGVIIAFNAIGLKWSQLQFLAAAVTFGLAFGLQEIFANFISGIIMLIERPVRVGDTVTVGGVSGDVTKINIRATTVRDWDRKELVIPNKTFVTDQFVNWTLSDSTQRLIIPVGVSYDADIDKVRTTLLSIARTTEHVMTDPSPYVVFQELADSTLNFQLRVYLKNLDNMLGTKSALHSQIITRFRNEGIEIAYPQQDLHIRSMASDGAEEK